MAWAAAGGRARLGTMAPALLAATILVGACSGAGGQRPSMGSPRGDVGGQRESAGTSSQGAGRPAQPSAETPTASPTGEGTLSSAELGLVYRLILERYVDRVEHASLVQAADVAVRDLELRTGSLPIDTAPLDLAPTPTGNPERDWQQFAQGYDAVVGKHPRWAAADRPDWAVLRQMLRVLGDNHSMFIEPEEMRRRAESGYSGIGVRMSKPEPSETPIVVEVFRDSPAARAGVQPGDRVIAVDGVSTAERPISEIVSGVRGAQGTTVRLRLSRRGRPGLETPIVRAPVEAPRVEGAVRGNLVGILRIRDFGDTIPDAVQQVLAQGRARNAQAWVLDLRGNPGGQLSAVARVASNFVDARPIALAVDRAGNREPLNAEGRPAISPTPLVVLVDKETASGAEVLAAALQEYKVAPLVGTTTAGSAGIAVPRPLSDGSAVQLTERRLISPSGARIDGVGVRPDAEVELSIADLEQGDDPQMTRALELLLEQLQGQRPR